MFADLWSYLRVRKKFWLLPPLIALTLFFAVVLVTQPRIAVPMVQMLFGRF